MLRVVNKICVCALTGFPCNYSLLQLQQLQSLVFHKLPPAICLKPIHHGTRKKINITDWTSARWSQMRMGRELLSSGAMQIFIHSFNSVSEINIFYEKIQL